MPHPFIQPQTHFNSTIWQVAHGVVLLEKFATRLGTVPYTLHNSVKGLGVNRAVIAGPWQKRHLSNPWVATIAENTARQRSSRRLHGQCGFASATQVWCAWSCGRCIYICTLECALLQVGQVVDLCGWVQDGLIAIRQDG